MIVFFMFIIVYAHYCVAILPEQVLDINNPPEETIHYQFIHDTINYRSLIPRSATNIRRLVDGDVIIWESDHDQRKCRHVTYHRNVFGRAVISIEIYERQALYDYVHFSFTNGSWQREEQENYGLVLDKLLSERRLDVNACSSVITCNKESTIFGNTISSFDPTGEHNIIEVTEGNEVIWRRDSDEVCKHVTLYNRLGLNVLLFMKIANGDIYTAKYLEKNDASWVEIPVDLFIERREYILSEFRLDLTCKESQGRFRVVEHHPYGLLANIFIENSNVHTTEIVEGDNIVWKSPDGIEKCTMAVAHLKEDKPILVHLCIKTKQVSDCNIYFIKLDDGSWIKTTKEEFYTKLEEHDSEDESLPDLESIHEDDESMTQ